MILFSVEPCNRYLRKSQIEIYNKVFGEVSHYIQIIHSTEIYLKYFWCAVHLTNAMKTLLMSQRYLQCDQLCSKRLRYRQIIFNGRKSWSLMTSQKSHLNLSINSLALRLWIYLAVLVQLKSHKALPLGRGDILLGTLVSEVTT
jgi:hypothetical protein